MIGKTLAHYEILEKIGSGGMGEVYLAGDSRLGRKVAIKMIAARSNLDSTAKGRLLREARTASALNHPNICTVHDVGEESDGAYIVMEYVEGRGLETVIPENGMSPRDVTTYGAQIADALAHAHERGIIHRDLKTSNVVLTSEGRVKVLDFGLARRVGAPDDDVTRTLETATTTGISGTLSYMPPEVLRGEPADAKSDLWALGVMLYEMLTGTLPFPGRTGFEISSAILTDPPRPLPDRIPRGLAQVVLRCLTKERSQRYQGAAALKEALEAVEEDPATLPLTAAAPPADRGRIRSLAVLPLDNLSGDPAQDYFADGMTEAITANMAKIGSLRVISRTSAMQYKGSRKPLPEIARELSVDAIVEGSVHRSGGRVRITAQLIATGTDEHLWAETYDRNLADVLELQAEVSRAIVEEIRGTLSPKERADLGGVRRVDPAVYEAYLKGRHFWERRTVESLRQGIEYYEIAIGKDPTYALAYVGIAECHNVLGFQAATPPRDSFAPAAAAARKALELDSSLAEAHISLAYASLHYDWNWAKVEEGFLKGLELGPNYPTGHHWYALYLTCLGRRDEALAEMEKAWELDPLAPIMRTAIGWVRYFFRDYDESITQYRMVLEVNPDFWAARLMLGTAYVAKAMIPQALEELRLALDASGNQPMVKAAIGYALAMSGKKDEPRQILEALETLSRQRYVRPYDLGLIHLGLGAKEKAVRCLRDAFQERGNWLNYLKVDPVWDPLRGEKQFEELVGKVFEQR